MSRKQDETDRKILSLLAENGRQSVKELARRIGLSRSATQERLARLEREGAIAGYTIRRNEHGNGAVAAYMFVKTRQALCDDLAPLPAPQAGRRQPRGLHRARVRGSRPRAPSRRG
mgnify:CR=1 FL=1